MPTYVTLINWTSEGIQTVKQGPSRLDATRKAFEALGVKMKDFYLMMGRYDLMFIVDAPDDAAVAKALLSVGAQGRLRTETCRAFTEQEPSDRCCVAGGRSVILRLRTAPAYPCHAPAIAAKISPANWLLLCGGVALIIGSDLLTGQLRYALIPLWERNLCRRLSQLLSAQYSE